MDLILALVRPLFDSAFTLGGVVTTWLELLAFVLSLAMVACNIRTLWWGWPLAAISSLLYFFLFWDTRVYGQASLQLFFIGMALWGWWQWLLGRDDQGKALAVRASSASERVMTLVLIGLLWPLLGLFLSHYTTSPAPWWDAFTTAASIIGTWLLGRKRIENWMVWLLVNITSVGLFTTQGLWLTGVLYGVLALMSVQGWMAWKRQLSGDTDAPPPYPAQPAQASQPVLP